MNLSVKVAIDHPYAKTVESFFAQELPGTNLSTSEDVLEQVSTALIGSGQYRYGSVPSPESQVEIRKVLRKAITGGYPIPILVPYGSRKSVLGEPIDIAEVMSLRQISCLNHRIKQFYSPGIQARLRLEDASGNYLFTDDGQQSLYDTADYCDAMSELVSILGYDFLTIVPESSLFDEQEYTKVANSIYTTLFAYITEADKGDVSDAVKGLLMQTGWKGTIPKEQREFYYNRYRAVEPSMSPERARAKLAKYFAGSWARIQCNGSGAAPAWGDDYIRVTFVPPIPGMPESMTQKYVYYRTVPLKHATSHMPPWRAKGFLKLNGFATPKIASWHAKSSHEYIKSSVMFGRASRHVEVRSDFVIED